MESRRAYPRPAAEASALANEAAIRGIRPPLRLLSPGDTSRGWLLVPGDPDSLYADEYGEMWWGREPERGDVRVVRACWPEEALTYAGAIASGVRAVLEPARVRPAGETP